MVLFNENRKSKRYQTHLPGSSLVSVLTYGLEKVDNDDLEATIRKFYQSCSILLLFYVASVSHSCERNVLDMLNSDYCKHWKDDVIFHPMFTAVTWHGSFWWPIQCLTLVSLYIHAFRLRSKFTSKIFAPVPDLWIFFLPLGRTRALLGVKTQMIVADTRMLRSLWTRRDCEGIRYPGLNRIITMSWLVTGTRDFILFIFNTDALLPDRVR